jgi:hypothetical protein
MSIRSSAVGLAAVVVLMGAGAAQSLSGSNTVFGDDIVDGTITTPDLKTGALSGSKILDNSVTGTDVNESTLVPTCPPATTSVADICFTPLRVGAGGGVTFITALGDCVDEHLRLPSLSEARMLTADTGATQQWTDVFYDDGGIGEVVIVASDGFATDSATANHAYHCVTTVGARP